MSPFNTIAVIDLNGEMYYVSLSGHVELIDRRVNQTLFFSPGIVGVSTPSSVIAMEQQGGGGSPTASISIAFEAVDMWTLTRQRQQSQTGKVNIYSVYDGNKYLDQCTLMYSGIIGPVDYDHQKQTWSAPLRPQTQNVDTVFPPISAGETKRYGIIDWPAVGVSKIESERGLYAYPGAITKVANNSLQNGSSALPVVYGTVYGASVPVLQARLVTWNHNDHVVYSALMYDIGIASHPVIGSPQYSDPAITTELIDNIQTVSGGAYPETWVDVHQDGYLIPNESVFCIPADPDGNGRNRRQPSPVYYKRDRLGSFTAVANLWPPELNHPLPTPDWVDLDAIQGVTDDHGHEDPFVPLMPQVDTGQWNIPILEGKPRPDGSPIDGLGDVLVDIWRQYARGGYGDLDTRRISMAVPMLNKYKVGLLFNEKPKLLTVTRMIASRIAQQFPVSLGAQTGVWGFDCLEMPTKSHDIFFK